MLHVDLDCWDRAEREGTVMDGRSTWAHEARERCHIGGDKMHFSTRMWSEDRMLTMFVLGVVTAAASEDGLWWVAACLPLACLGLVRALLRKEVPAPSNTAPR